MKNKMEQKEYNGWHNYETWLVNLWLTNDSCSYDYWVEVTNESENIHELSERIKDEIEEFNPLNDKADLYADLMSAAISEVNFYEIAESFWDDFKEIEEEEEEDSD